MEEDRSALFNQLKGFSQGKLKKVETKVVTPSGENLVEKRGAKGLQVLGNDAQGQEEQRKLDLQVGFILPGLLIGAHDVAHDKETIESYGITHILNLDKNTENKYEDDYNYKNVNMQNTPDYDLAKIYDDCFDFIDDGRHYGNVLVHCDGASGVSRSTAICVAYLMTKEKQRFSDALNTVKEARPFVRLNEGFDRQLKEYDKTLSANAEKKDDKIEDAFTLRKRQEIESEKAMVAGASSVKDRMKMFGATLNANSNNNSRAKSVSPAPTKFGQSLVTQKNSNSLISKSVTPEPRRDIHSIINRPNMTANETPRISSNLNNLPSFETKYKTTMVSDGTPPPPPPPPASLYDTSANKQSALNKSNITQLTKTSAPPPPPPPPPSSKFSTNNQLNDKFNGNNNNDMTKPQLENSQTGVNNLRMVFGRVPPPPMKIKGGLSIERQDSIVDTSSRALPKMNETVNTNNHTVPSFDITAAMNRFQKSSIQLPLKKQLTTDHHGNGSSTSTDNRTSSNQTSTGGQQDNSNNDRSVSPLNKSNKSGLTRSSTKKILNLIKTKTKGDLTMLDAQDENDEIEALLGALETETVDNIDWEELGLDENEVRDIISKSATGSDTLEEDGEADEVDKDDSSSSSSDEDDDEGDDDDDDQEVETETTTQHFVIRTRY